MVADQRFVNLASKLRSSLSDVDQAAVEVAVSTPVRKGASYGFDDVGIAAASALTALAKIKEPIHRTTASRALIAARAAHVMDNIQEQNVPTELVQRTAAWLETLYKFLLNDVHAEYRFQDDLFMKDFRFVTGMTIPCGAQVVDLAERIGPKTALKLVRSGPMRAVSAVTGPWFRPHTESRYLEEFTEAGWTHCYGLIAQLLVRRPAVRGMIATSWFYDPQLTIISPRLAYLRKLPANFGAVLVAHGTTPFDIKSATSTSQTRLRLYKEGKFTPVCHSIMWFRKDMLSWAKLSGVL